MPVTELVRPVSTTHQCRYTGLLLSVVLLLCSGMSAQAAQQSKVERWPQIKEALLGDRVVRDGTGIIALETPKRALDAAVVPVDITTGFEQTPDRYISKLYLVIDNNPSPVAAVFDFPGNHNWKTISTRVRVNAYTDVRVLAELNDGDTFMTANFVKASGGCSAPALKDPAAAAAQLGKMKLVMPQDNEDDLFLARLMVRHPNSSGLQFDQIKRHYIPADYVSSIEVSYKDQPLYSVVTDISISENPTIAFGFAGGDAGGEFDVQVKDSQGRQFEQRFSLQATP